MQRPLDITFRGMAPSMAVEAAIHHWVGRLEHAYGRIQGCSVVVEQPHLHHRQGNEFAIRIDLSLPGRDLAVARSRAENAFVAVAGAFRAARRQLQGHAQRLQHHRS